MGKNIYSLPIWQRADIQDLQRTKTDLQKHKQAHSKVGKFDMNRHFSKEDLYEANRHEKMLIITGYQRDANQNHIEIPSHAR